MTSVFTSGEAAGAVDGRYNILLLGGDSGVGRVGLRPDSIQLASVDAETGRRGALRLLPRDREHHGSGPGSVMAGPDAGGLDLRRRVPAQRPLHVGHRPQEEVPGGHQGPRPARDHRGGRGARPGSTSSTTCSSTSRASAASSTPSAASTSPCSGARRSAPSTRSRAGSRRATSTSTATTPSGTPAAGPTRRTTSGWRASAASSPRWSASSTRRRSCCNFSDIAKATKGVFRTDIPQEALVSLATLAVKTKQQKITSVNFVPPLIKPWNYDPQVVRDTVASTIDKAETADEQAAPKADGDRPPRRRRPRPAPTKASKPKKQAVMDRPASRPGRQHQRPRRASARSADRGRGRPAPARRM